KKQRWIPILVEADHTPAASKRCRDVKPPLSVDGHALRSSKPAIIYIHLAGWGDAIDGIKAGSCRAAYVEIPVQPDCQMIGCDGRFERGEYIDLSRAADFEDGAAAVADV